MSVEQYQAVIGLEVHCQLKTKSKLFCGCSTEFGNEPNQNTCPVCLGLPGALPVLNRAAVDFAIKMAKALNADLNQTSIFARKQYFYPDLPKGYQISQYDQPLCVKGRLKLSNGRTINITRVHMEEDAGKNIHVGEYSFVDLNRAGVPLIEIVSEPEIHSPEEAVDYLKKLRSIARYLEISDGNLEEGSFRCDANVSVRKKSSSVLGVRTELKNINSFRNVERAIKYEVIRQIDIIESGQIVKQATLQFDAASGKTIMMRSKEFAEDYRYFPEPDLKPLILSQKRVADISTQTPELADERAGRFEEQYQLTQYDAVQLTEEKELAEFFERTYEKAKKFVTAKSVANWILTEFMRELNLREGQFDKIPVSPESLAELLILISKNVISGKIAKTVFLEMAASGEKPDSIVNKKGLVQVSDKDTVEKFVEEVLTGHKKQLEQYLSGKEKVYGFFVGEIMKRAQGKLNPGLLNELLKNKLAERKIKS